MKFTENKFRLTPEVNEVTFSFDNLFLSNVTGEAEIGLSGNGNLLRFRFADGNIYDPEDSFIRTYNASERIKLAGDVKSDSYRYYINNQLFRIQSKADYDFQRFFVNVTGVELTSDNQLRTNSDYVNNSITMIGSFVGGNNANGNVNNSTSNKFRVFKANYSYLENASPSFTGNFSGDVNGNSSLSFSLPDLNSSYGDSHVKFKMILDSSLGELSENFDIFRTGNITGNINIIDTTDFADQIIDYEWEGSGFNNGFIFDPPSSGENVKVYYYSLLNNDGIETPKSVNYHIYPVTDTTGVTGTGKFITGYNLTNSGYYEEVPEYYFTSYSNITGADFKTNNLFSEDCGTSIPALFVASSGYGASGSGTALLERVRISLYGSETFYTITGFSVQNQGSGYNYDAPITLLTGDVSATCFDVPYVSGNSYIYETFSGSGQRHPVADYFYGSLLTGESVKTISGTGYTGYGITGIRITNMGSGYNEASGYTPEIVFTRNGNTFQSIYDLSGFHHSGTMVYNLSGDYYDFLTNWTIKTGSTATGLVELATGAAMSLDTGYSGTVNMAVGEDTFMVSTSFDQPSLTQNYQIGIAVEPSGQSNTSGVISIVTARTTYPTGSGAFWVVPFEPADTNLISF